MDDSKYDREITLLCGTCGYDKLEKESDDLIRCPRCGRETTQSDLEESNSERIQSVIDEMTEEMTKDATKELEKMFSKINKTLTIKL